MVTQNIIFDTNAYSWYLKGHPLVFDYLSGAENVYISIFVIGELIYGFKKGTQLQRNLKFLNIFLSKPMVTISSSSAQTAEIYGDVKNQLRKKGKMIPNNDIWIAAHAFEVGGTLITYDKHFLNVPGLQLWPELTHKNS